MSSRYDPECHHRRSIRLKGYDYTQPGTYFVTLCTRDRKFLFGDIVNGAMCLNDAGRLIADAWKWLSIQYPYVMLDEYVVMPNHLHGIIVIADHRRGGSRTAPTPIRRKPLGGLIGAFKTTAAKHVNRIRNTPNQPIWQRNYYERVIRNENELDRVREYIISNPARWAFDSENPLAAMPKEKDA